MTTEATTTVRARSADGRFVSKAVAAAAVSTVQSAIPENLPDAKKRGKKDDSKKHGKKADSKRQAKKADAKKHGKKADREEADSKKQAKKADCLAYINEVWTDMRPLSLRKKMSEQ